LILIDVISVQSLAFKRFLDIANLLNKNVAVITDNDGDFSVNITQKYNEYLGLAHILISADHRNALHTLEPQFFDVNKADLVKFRQVIGYPSTYTTSEEIIKYMINQKTDWALKLFESDEVLEYPDYIKDVVDWCAL
jgi:putative ATP-dependent endonuclease of OLD family